MKGRSRSKRTIGVSWHQPTHQFRKYVGKQVGRSGKLVPKVHYLGANEKDAIRRATSLVAEWDAIRAAGGLMWPSTHPSPEVVASTPRIEAKPDRLVSPENITVEDAANLYLEEIHLRATAQQVGWAYYNGTSHRLERVLECLGRKTPLRCVGASELNKAVLYFVGRPPSKARPHQKRPFGHPISIKTAKDFISQLKALFTWLSEHDRIEWVKPKRFEKIFRVRVAQMKTAEERARDQQEVVTGEVETFTLDELGKLFAAAKPRERLYLLLGLNCGFTSSEISTLAPFEIDLSAAHPFIHRKRHKTQIEARWRLWPETVEAVRSFLTPKNKHNTAFLTPGGNQLVEVKEGFRRDCVDQAWVALSKRACLGRWLGFRFLRKTGADRMKKMGGLEISEMYLSHSEPNAMNRHYANRDWDKMHGYLDQFGQEIRTLWTFKSDSGSGEGPEASSESPEQREAA